MMMINSKIFLVLSCLILVHGGLLAQEADSLPTFDYRQAKTFEIGGVTVSGAFYSDAKVIVAMTDLRVGDKIEIPGPKIQKAMKALLKLRLYNDVQIRLVKTIGDVAFLDILVSEPPRLSRYSYRGVKKTHHDDLNEQINRFLIKGTVITESLKQNAVNVINQYFLEKGYLDVATRAEERKDTAKAISNELIFWVKKGERVKIKEITFTGNEAVKSRKLRKQLSETKEKSRLFASSKFQQKNFEADKLELIKYYNSLGYRDAQTVEDTTWRDDKGLLHVQIDLKEGIQYHFGDIEWKGNSKYSTRTLNEILNVKKGELYNTNYLQKQLTFSPDGRDVSSLYMDNGYLFFQVDPVEVAVRNDTIDLEIRVFEGPQATIRNVMIAGNTVTKEHVIRRELRTLPGEKFSRSDIIRSQRELINLGYFNPEALDIKTPVDPQSGTVDIIYTVEEKSANQFELSAGFYDGGVVGTLGFSFNNFSFRNLFSGDIWQTIGLPQGDGQRLSIRAQSNGKAYQSLNLSFTEPWLGGKKPNSFTVAGFVNRYTNGLSSDDANQELFYLSGLSASLGTRLSWPDDYFVSTTAVNLQRISLRNWGSGLFVTDDGTSVADGNYNNFSIKQTISRSSIDNPLFPTRGSLFSLSLQFTPPYSLFSQKDYSDLDTEETFKWIEYHKWRFEAAYYTPIVDKLVLKVGAKLGYLGYYNSQIGYSPFERFQLGGDGLNNQSLGFQGTDIIALRGYEVEDLDANSLNGTTVATPIFQKFTIEARYPLSTNPNSTIYGLVFAEAGNAWRNFETYNPFEMKKSVGVGLRVYLPMFGLLGFDYGIGLDHLGTAKPIGNFNIILGFEPD